MTAREFMSTPVVSVQPEATIKHVIEQMAAHRVSGLPVVDRQGHLMGVISESDILARLEHGGKGTGLAGLVGHFAQPFSAIRKLHGQTAAEIMTAPAITAGPEASFRELLHLMTAHNVNRLPIVEGGQVIGIVTRADILRTMTRADTTITEDVRWHLIHDLWVDPTSLEITTREGIVTISGEVGTRSEAELVKRWVAMTEGAVDVDASGLRYRLDDRHIVPPTGSLESPRRK
ncbi:MAG TPA: CBS domain-containing protein [bacterium]|nr:CBS domain-containing protein [bacterium]